jgi:dihydropyrimidinase
MSELDLLITGGTVVTPWGPALADLGVLDGKIHDIAASPSGLAARERVDASGRLVLPGGVDPHVHFENPSSGTVTTHDFGLGTEAAALGGTTCVIDFAFQTPQETPLETIIRRRTLADPQVVIDYGLHGCITRTDERSLADLPAMIDYGCPSTKVFMVYKNEGWMVGSGHLLDIMTRMAALGGTLAIHAENEELLEWGIGDQLGRGNTSALGHARSRPPVVEVEAIRRGIYFAMETGCQLFVVHMSTSGGVRAVREGLAHGAPVAAETCAHYLLLDESYLERPDGYRYVMSPPLRPAEEQDALWEGLQDGTVASVGSDDASYFEKDKIRGRDDFRKIANGIPGVQARLPLIYSTGVRTGRLSLERFVDAVATQPAKLFGLYPRKGILAPGSDADIVIFDTEITWRPTLDEMHTNIEYTCYEDFELTGRPVHVWSRGSRVVEDGKLVGTRGWGRFLARPPARWPESDQA